MATKIPRVIADLELQLATAVAVGATSFTLSSANDDDGEALPAGLYVFAVDSGTSNKEYLLGQLNGVNVTSVQNVTRQGVQSSGADRAHRVGAPVILTNFAALQLVADTLRGAVDLDAGAPLSYDGTPTLNDNAQLATVGYVLATVTGGDVSFDKQTIAGNAGATVAAGDLVYLDEADQEWKLCDADTAATVEGVMRGIALGSGTDGAAITGGVHLAGAWTTTGLTPGALYYASNTAGDLATSAGTVKHIVGVALSATRLWVIPQHRETIPTRTKDALAGGGDFGTPSASNKFLTEEYSESRKSTRQIFTASGTWTKPANLAYVEVEVQAKGGNGANTGGSSSNSRAKGGGGGGYAKKRIQASDLAATIAVTVNAATDSFGSHCSATAGSNGASYGTSTTEFSPGGTGGTATGGDINIDGRNGHPIINGVYGRDGDSVLGSGAVPLTTTGDGNAGIGYGGGGGGANDFNRTGGAGAPGIVIVTEYYS